MHYSNVIRNLKASAAGMAAATRGRDRVFGTAKKPKIDDHKELISEGMQEYIEKKGLEYVA